PIGDAGAIDYRGYAGTSHLAVADRPSSSTHSESLGTPIVAGGRLLWETPLTGLSAAGSGQYLHIEGRLFFEPALVAMLIEDDAVPSTFSGLASYDLKALLLLASLEYAQGDLLLAAEYGRWHVQLDGSPIGALPPADGWT